MKQGSHIFSKTISTLFQYHERTLIQSRTFIFPKFYSWNTMQNSICTTVISDKEHNVNKQMAEFGIYIHFQ